MTTENRGLLSICRADRPVMTDARSSGKTGKAFLSVRMPADESSRPGRKINAQTSLSPTPHWRKVRKLKTTKKQQLLNSVYHQAKWPSSRSIHVKNIYIYICFSIMWSRAKNLPGRQFTVLGNTWALCGAWQHCCISLFLKNEGCFNMSIMHTCILPDNLFSWHCKSFKMDAKLGKYASGTKPVDSLQRIYWHGK